MNERELLDTVRINGLALTYVQKQTMEACLEAVKQNGYVLKYVKEQTPEICLSAVKQDSNALKYVKSKSMLEFESSGTAVAAEV